MDVENENVDDCTEALQFIGLRIAYFRRLRNMTQAQLAKKVHINKNYLSHIECGAANKAVSLPLLIKISRALDVELSFLVDFTDMKDPKDIVRQQLDEVKELFEDMKQFSAELDRMMLGMNSIGMK